MAAAAPRPADLSISYTRPQGAVAGSEQVTYTVHVANAGSGPATQVKVVNTLPPGTTFASAGGIGWDCDDPVKGVVACVLPRLAAGANAPPLGIAVTTPSQGGTFKAVATVSAAEPDPVPGNNTAEHSVAVSARKGSTP